MAEQLTNPGVTLPTSSESYNIEVFNENFRNLHTAINENNITISEYTSSIKTEGTSPDTAKDNNVTNNYSAIIGGYGNTAKYDSDNDVSDNVSGSLGSYTTDTAFNGIFCSRNSTVNGPASVVIGGRNNTVSGEGCISLGGVNNTISNGSTNSVVIGKKNNLNGGKDCLIVGNETSVPSSANSLIAVGYNVGSINQNTRLAVGNGGSSGSYVGMWVNHTGSIDASDSINSNVGRDYAEYFEWSDGNPNEEDRVGLLVSLDGNKIALANENTIPFGIVSALPAVCGNTAGRTWHGQIKTDIFGRWIFDEDGNPLPSDEFDSTLEYIPRSERPEWSPIGLVGQLVLIDDGTTEVNGFVKAKENGIGTHSETQTRFQVMERLDESHVRVLVL